MSWLSPDVICILPLVWSSQPSLRVTISFRRPFCEALFRASKLFRNVVISVAGCKKSGGSVWASGSMKSAWTASLYWFDWTLSNEGRLCSVQGQYTDATALLSSHLLVLFSPLRCLYFWGLLSLYPHTLPQRDQLRVEAKGKWKAMCRVKTSSAV